MTSLAFKDGVGSTTQLFRTFFGGSVALGGNGQFMRSTALDSIMLGRFEEYYAYSQRMAEQICELNVG
ncbi:MAG: hypothetical protein OEZ48_09580 [Candidatus Bathyarchaeota archaeon]|nr:hypothetical protein [Candidatus Bathyarchaeota archaeon]